MHNSLISSYTISFFCVIHTEYLIIPCPISVQDREQRLGTVSKDEKGLPQYSTIRIDIGSAVCPKPP